MRGRFVGLMLACAACGGTSSPGVGQPDATTQSDAPSGADGAPTGDSGIRDAGGVDSGPGYDGAVTACDACAPDWCGCGQCEPRDIVCTRTPLSCPLGCASGCQEQTSTVCGCAGDRCVFVTPPRTSPACYTSADCPPGMCCPGRDGGLLARSYCVTQSSSGCP